MTNEQLDKIAAKVYHDIYGTDAFHKEEVIEFARRLLAEVQKMQEPVAWMVTTKKGQCMGFLPEKEENCIPVYLHPAPAVPEALKLLERCRSSVKFDLLTYEKRSRAYGNIGDKDKHEVVEAEANRLRKLLDAIDAHPAPAVPEGWQTIETAPRDGTEILVYTRYDNRYVVTWDGIFSAPWRIRNNEGINKDVPTHWMPLPAAPKGTP